MSVFVSSFLNRNCCLMKHIFNSVDGGFKRLHCIQLFTVFYGLTDEQMTSRHMVKMEMRYSP